MTSEIGRGGEGSQITPPIAEILCVKNGRAIEVCGFLMKYRNVASSRLSRLVAHPSIFRLFMKENFDAYVL